MGGNSDRCDAFLCLFICESTGDNQPVLPQHKDPKGAQSLNASHFRDVIVIQVQENKLLQMWQMLDHRDSIVLEVEEL